MKRLCMSLVLVMLSLNGCAWWQQQETQETEIQRHVQATRWLKPAASIGDLLAAIQHLVAVEDFDGLRQHLYSYEVLGIDVPEAIIYGIRQGVKSDDFAYSETALEALRSQYLDQFRSVSDSERSELIGEFFRDDKFLSWHQQSSPRFWLFEHSPNNAPEGYYDVTVVVIEEDGVYRLVFWENLDCLLRCEAPRSN